MERPNMSALAVLEIIAIAVLGWGLLFPKIGVSNPTVGLLTPILGKRRP